MAGIAYSSTTAEDLSARINKRVTNYNLSVFTFVEALMHVSSDFEVPMGIAWVSKPAAKAALAFAWKDATVRQIIEAIVETHPGYRLELKNGVVQISPESLVAEEESFLATKIKTFQAQNEYTEVVSDCIISSLRQDTRGLASAQM
jgi:hypothetical protein